MSVIISNQEVDVIHVRYNGKSYDFNTSDFNMAVLSKTELFNAVEAKLDVISGSLSGFELDIKAEIKTGIIHPSAKFGV